MAEVSVITQSAITCPNCGSVKAETMPIDSFQFFYICNGCGETLHPPCAAVRNVRKPAGERTAGFRHPVAGGPPIVGMVRWACVLGDSPFLSSRTHKRRKKMEKACRADLNNSIQLTVPDGWANFHLPRASMALASIALGPGPLSLDRAIGMVAKRWFGATS